MYLDSETKSRLKEKGVTPMYGSDCLSKPVLHARVIYKQSLEQRIVNEYEESIKSDATSV